MTTSHIHQFGLKITLHVTKPQLTAKDDKATNDAETANNASNAGQYRKDLYPKHLIAPILEVESAARAFIAKNTIEAVLPASKILWFADQMNPHKTRYAQAVTVFMQNIANVITEAQKSQGDMFDQSLYPDTAALRARFTWDIRYDTVSDNGKFSAIMGVMDDASKAHLTNAIHKQVEDEQLAITREALERMHKVIGRLAVSAARPDRAVVNKSSGGIDVRPPIFKASIVENIKEMADLLEGYAAALPPDVLALRDKALALTAHNHVSLKDNPDARKRTQMNAALLANEIAHMLGYADALPVDALPEPVDELPEPVDELPEPEPEPAIVGITVLHAKAAPKEYTTGGSVDFSELEF